MPVIAVVLSHREQPRIFHIGIGQNICRMRCGANKPLFQKKPDKPALRHIQLFGSSPEIGAVL